MCRYTCSGCCWGNIYRVRNYELIEEEECEPFIRLEIDLEEVPSGFLCLKFRSIPVGLTSYPLVLRIGRTDYPIETATREVTSADLRPCMLLSGTICDCKYIVC